MSLEYKTAITGDSSSTISILAIDENTATPVKLPSQYYAELDSSTSKLKTDQIPDSILGGVNYQGTWNASTNSPTIPTASSSNKGYYYKVNTAGTTTIDGTSVWNAGDWIISNGSTWDRIQPVETTTVFGGSGTSHSSGLVPDPGATAGTSKYLCENGAWTVPVASGSTSGYILLTASSTIVKGSAVMVDSSGYGTQTSLDLSKAIGIAQSAVSSGSTFYVALFGQSVSACHTSLTTNALYYIQSDGTVSTSSSSYLIGRAISATQIDLNSSILSSYGVASVFGSATANVSGTTYATTYAIAAATWTTVTCAATVQQAVGITGSSGTLQFTVIQPGYYQINAGTVCVNSTGACWFATRIAKNGVSLVDSPNTWTSSAVAGQGSDVSGSFLLAAGDIITCKAYSQYAGYIQGGYLNIQLVSGAAAVTGQSVDYVRVWKTTATSYSSGGVVIFDVIDTSSGSGVSYSTSTGYFTLAAGKTYRVEGGHRQSTATSAMDLMWYNVTTGTYIAYTYSSVDSDTGNGDSPCAFYITPTVTTQICHKMIAGSGTLCAARSWAAVTQIGTSSVIQFGGATSSTAGYAGTVPTPSAGDQYKPLLGGGGYAAQLRDTGSGVMLGASAPAILMKKLTVTLASVGAGVSVAHGLTLSNIIGVQCLATNSYGNKIPPGYAGNGSDLASFYSFLLGSSDVTIYTGSSASTIAGYTATILITYEA